MITVPMTMENSSISTIADLKFDRFGKFDLLLSDAALVICQWITFSVICQGVDLFGTITNIINIICFVKLGFKDPVNISFLSLAISDLGCLISLMWTNICLTPAFSTLDLPFDSAEFQYLTGGWPHITFTRVTSWITALITLERCLCITAPLKVKSVITPKRTCILMVSVFAVLIFSVAPVYCVNMLGLKFYPNRNRTLIGLVFASDRESVEKVSFAINNILVSFSAFMIIIICTMILVFQLHKKTEWRQKSSNNIQTDNVTHRHLKVAKMVVMISTLFIACFVPVSIICVAMSIEPEMSAAGLYRNLVVMLSGFCFTLESINSASNIFIYYNMSSKYRDVFHQLFKKASPNKLV